MTIPARRDYPVLSDVELAAAIGRRDAQAVRTVTQRNNQRLYRVAWCIVRNRSEAEDIVQETYLRAFSVIGQFKGHSSLSTWLTRIAINEALARKRSADRRTQAFNSSSVLVMNEYREKLMGSPETRSSPESALMRKQLAKLIESAISQLPESFRMVFVLREVEGLSVEETAEALQILPETVKTRFLRARRRLQKLIDPELRNAMGDAFPFAGADCEALTTKVLERLGLSGQENMENGNE